MSVYKIVAEFAHMSGLPEDKMVNQWIVQGDEDLPLNRIGEITINLHRFYNAPVAPNAEAVAQYFGPGVNRGVPVVYRVYDIGGHLDGSPHGSPYAIDTGVITVAQHANSNPLPEECAVGLTLHGEGWANALAEVPDDAGLGINDPDNRPDRPKQRHTGGISLGMLNDAAIALDGGMKVRVHSNLRGTMSAATLRLIEELWGFGHRLVVWSRKDLATRSVEGGFIDNAFDTQRSRGPDPNVRTTFLVPGGAH